MQNVFKMRWFCDKMDELQIFHRNERKKTYGGSMNYIQIVNLIFDILYGLTGLIVLHYIVFALVALFPHSGNPRGICGDLLQKRCVENHSAQKYHNL